MGWCAKRIKAIPYWQSACKVWATWRKWKKTPIASRAEKKLFRGSVRRGCIFQQVCPRLPRARARSLQLGAASVRIWIYIALQSGQHTPPANPFQRGEISLQPNWIGICARQGNAAIVINSQLFINNIGSVGRRLSYIYKETIKSWRGLGVGYVEAIW